MTLKKPKSPKTILSLIFLLALLIAIPIGVYTVATQKMETRKEAKEPGNQPELRKENLVEKYEPSSGKFEEIQTNDKIIYFHQRMLDQAIVEKDFINYQFDKKSKQLVKKTTHWQNDLPNHLPPLSINEDQARLMVEGEIQFSNLYIISPESDIFPLKPTPTNPCWVVSSTKDEINSLTIIDAVTGKKLGYGIAPPSLGYERDLPFLPRGVSLSGPVIFKTTSPTCEGTWTSWTAWYTSAARWFLKMGYLNTSLEWPSEESLKKHLQNSQTVVFYEIAHGDSYLFWHECSFYGLSPIKVREWLLKRKGLTFSFIASCGGMCYTGEGTFSYELTKGSNTNSATVGYCGMGSSGCANCWAYSVLWQDAMFKYIYEGYTVRAAFDKALQDYPACQFPKNCMRFAGDPTLRIEAPVSPQN